MSTFLEMAEQWMRENLTVPTTRKAENESLPSSIPPGHPAWLSPAGKWVTVFPHCPRCASYALNPENSAYECLTCGLTGIREADTRKAGARQEAHA